MKKTILFAFILIIGICLNLKSQNVKGNGNIVEKERNISDFKSLSVKDGLDLFIDQGETSKVVIKADENLHDLIITEVSLGELKIYIDGNIWKSETLEAYVTIETIESLTASDGSDVESLEMIELQNFVLECTDGSDLKMELKANQLSCTLEDGSDAILKGEFSKVNLDASDGSDVEANISVEEISCKIDEGSDVNLKGKAIYANVYAQQGSDLEGFDFSTENFSLKAYSGSDANIFVTKNLDVTARGGSDVSIKGNPENKNIDASDDSDIYFR